MVSRVKAAPNDQANDKVLQDDSQASYIPGWNVGSYSDKFIQKDAGQVRICGNI